MSDFLNDVFYHQGSTNVPVVIPMTTFSPPSNPVVHHSLIGPIAFVGIPPLVEKNNVKETLCEYFFALHNSGRISLHPSFLGCCVFQVLGNEECDLLSLELCLCISSQNFQNVSSPMGGYWSFNSCITYHQHWYYHRKLV